MSKSQDFDKKQAFNRIWFKEGNSPVRDRLKAKVKQRGLEPTEKMCFEFWLGYIRPFQDRRGKVLLIIPSLSKRNNEKKGNFKPRRVGRHNKKKRRRPQ